MLFIGNCHLVRASNDCGGRSPSFHNSSTALDEMGKAPLCEVEGEGGLSFQRIIFAKLSFYTPLSELKTVSYIHCWRLKFNFLISLLHICIKDAIQRHLFHATSLNLQTSVEQGGAVQFGKL